MTTAKAKRGSFVPNLTSRLTPPLIALILAIVLFLLGGVISPGFVNANQAINIVRLAAFLGIIAAGQTLVIISGGEGIDLSVDALGNATVRRLEVKHGLPFRMQVEEAAA